MKNIIGFLNRLFGLNKVNEGYIGLTSFGTEDAAPVLKKQSQNTAKETSFTGLLKHVN